MKSIDLFCASQASTAICSSMDQRATVRHGTRPIDHRGNHQIGDPRKPKNIHPNPYHQKSRKSDSSSSAKQSHEIVPRKSSPNINDLSTSTPPGSSRYLLSDTPFIDFVSDSDHLSALVVSQPMILSSDKYSLTNPVKSQLVVSQYHRTSNDSLVLKSSSARSRPRYQVVELMVSIHCKGCEGKVRKHISRMEGVTSFSIDRVTKKVTVIGDVTPLGVLSSISRVKNARFWPSSSSQVVALSS